ncbi:ribonuclease H-like domain-containing protein, partial [Tanacetum coccineum]
TIDESKRWHRRLGHVNFKTMNKLVKGNVVRGLPSKTFENDHTYVACQKGKQHKASCKTKLMSSISQPLQMLHIDLFGPTSAEAVNTGCYVLDRVLVTKPHNKTPYELIISRAPSISFMRPFGCPVTILNTLDPLGKFDRNAEEGFLVSSDDKAKDYTVDDDACRKTVQELVNVVRKEFEAQCDSQENITRDSSTNNFNIVGTPVNTASASRTFSPIRPSSGPSFVPFGGSFPIDVTNLPHDPRMPKLEDTNEIQSTGIF